jgi:hypothetical protein
MSVKFQQETIRTTGVKPEDLTPKDLAHKVGERLTGGDTHTGYLAVCRSRLHSLTTTTALLIRYKPRPT